MTEEYQAASDQNIGARARTAAGWQFLSKGINTGLQMVTSIVLARLLMPADFGIVAMATMVTGLAHIFQDLGLGLALVQRKEITRDHTRSAFWGTLVMGLMLCGAVVLLAPQVGVFFDEPRMVPVLQLIALTFMLSPFATVPRALLQRDLDFQTPFFAGLASSVAYGGVGITMALLDYGYWSLVGATLASGLANTVALCILARYLPPLVPTFRGIRDLYGFGVGVTGSGLFNYTAGQLDYLVIGRRLDTDALGFYSRAFGLAHMPFTLLSSVLGPVLFPAFSALQADRERMQRGFGRTVRLTAALAFPTLALMGITAPEFIPLVFGHQWEDAVLPTQLLVVAAMFRVITNPAGALLRGLGRVYHTLGCQVVYCAVLGASAWYGAKWGVEGVAIGVVFGSASFFLTIALSVGRACGFSLMHYARHMAAPTLQTCIVAAASVCSRSLVMAAGASDLMILLATLLAGFVVGLFALLGPTRSLWPVLRDVVWVLRGGRRRSNAAS